MTPFLKRLLKIYALLLGSLGGVLAVYIGANAGRLFPDPKVVVVYGRDSCGITTAMKTRLDQSGIPYLYGNVDRPFVSSEMWYHLEKVASTDPNPTYAQFPIVLVNGQILETPDEELVLTMHKAANKGVEHES